MTIKGEIKRLAIYSLIGATAAISFITHLQDRGSISLGFAELRFREAPDIVAAAEPEEYVRETAFEETEDELFCLVQNIYHEARGEDYAHQVAVAHVTLNRVRSSRYPDTICGVVWEWRRNSAGQKVPQFSWTLDGKSDKMTDREAISQAVDIGIAAMRKQSADPTDGMMNYYNPDKITRVQAWMRGPKRELALGNHLFIEPRS